jgi:hypothetical protein
VLAGRRIAAHTVTTFGRARSSIAVHARLQATLDPDLAVYQNDLALHLLAPPRAPAWISVMSAVGPSRLQIARLDATP